MTYIRLEPKFPHINKYSQPFEQVLFHVIAIHIKCLKSSYYPHLLNNYLINYLNFSGLTHTRMLNELEDEHHIWKLEICEPFCLHHVNGVCPVHHHTILDTIHYHKITFIQGSMIAPPRHDDLGHHHR